jgi:hypothetical protein
MIIRKEITEHEFENNFSLVPNHIVPTRGDMFETFGEELDFVHSTDPSRVCTIVEGDDGELYIVSGYRWVNRFGYLILEEPFEDGFISPY